jgi:diguanylate cyclase (GGDEF)-like protein
MRWDLFDISKHVVLLEEPAKVLRDSLDRGWPLAAFLQASTMTSKTILIVVRSTWPIFGSLSVLLIDVDHFKSFNDIYGHMEGDRCLKEIAGGIFAAIRRPADTCARYGGEEFAVVLPNTDENGAWTRVNVIRQAISAFNLSHSGSETGHVTISVGISTSRGEFSQADLLKMADEALYTAKRSGRNKVISS